MTTGLDQLRTYGHGKNIEGGKFQATELVPTTLPDVNLPVERVGQAVSNTVVLVGCTVMVAWFVWLTQRTHRLCARFRSSAGMVRYSNPL